MKVKGEQRAAKAGLPLLTLDHKRDTYGFTVRPQHLQTYKEYSKIYREEEEERSGRWRDFLERQTESLESPSKEALPLGENEVESGSLGDAAEESPSKAALPSGDAAEESPSKAALPSGEKEVESSSLGDGAEFDHGSKAAEHGDLGSGPDEARETSGDASHGYSLEGKDARIHGKNKTWLRISPALGGIEKMMSRRIKKQNYKRDNNNVGGGWSSSLASIDEGRSSGGSLDYDPGEELPDVEKEKVGQEKTSKSLDGDDARDSSGQRSSPTAEHFFPSKEELESLVRGGLPMACRGELWQAFVGVPSRRVEGYYHGLLAADLNEVDASNECLSNSSHEVLKRSPEPEKWKVQIEKDLPRTFPGHPALDEDGRDALRRVLTAYARHNPSVGYCQAMNFFAGLLLLLMPEENAFWSLVGVIDDYFDGYYTEEMIDSQVDQLVFEELVREKFPKLANHLDYLGVEVAWITGPWFLSIFVNMLPWESVLRVWDVLLFDGNRVMLFCTALALMELYGPAMVTAKDAGDAVTLVQSLAGSTFDSSQLVLTACMGYQSVNEAKLKDLRDKYRPTIMGAMEERAKDSCSWKSTKRLASKLYSFRHDSDSVLSETCPKVAPSDPEANGVIDIHDSAAMELDEYMRNLNIEQDADTIPDLKEQVVWLKVELCKLLEEKRSSVLRAEELEIALMEMVQHDNRRVLSAKVEQLEQEITVLRQTLEDKHEQENAMLQVLMRVEQEQKSAEDARLFAEQDAAAQRYAAQMLQEKYEEAVVLLGQMEKRAVMAETMLEATIQYNAGQGKAQQSQSPRSLQSSQAQANQELVQDGSGRKAGLLSRPFGLGWRDKNKGKEIAVDNQDTTPGESTSAPPSS